jgi:hypothetical protein
MVGETKGVGLVLRADGRALHPVEHPRRDDRDLDAVEIDTLGLKPVEGERFTEPGQNIDEETKGNSYP